MQLHLELYILNIFILFKMYTKKGKETLKKIFVVNQKGILEILRKLKLKRLIKFSRGKK